MSEDPGHKAMLYFLEVLMNSNGPLTISQLAGRFGSRSFSAEMRLAAGGNEVGLKKFLLKYPSLFTVNGNMVSLFDGSKPVESPAAKEGSIGGGVTPSGRSLPDVSTEMEAVRFFQNKLLKKEERWVQVRSLAGHLSQAPLELRNVVGPQLDFRKWLLKHPHIFEVQGELVGLRDGIAAVATPTLHRRSLSGIEGIHNGVEPVTSVRGPPPRTPPATRRQFPPKSPASVRRSKSFGDRDRPSSVQSTEESVQPLTPRLGRRNAPVTMTANEYKAVMFLKDIIEKRGNVKLHNITGHFSQASEGVRNTIGWTKMELEEFLKKNANVFHVSEDETVTVIKNAKLNVIITGSRPQGQNIRTLSGRKGKVYHVAKLWGIIDLGKHEHVFFDKSIMKRPVDDMQKHYTVGEILSFNAVLAPKTSRAKWRATHVWKEHELMLSSSDSELSFGDRDSQLSPAISIEEEINQFLPQHDVDDLDKYLDSLPSGTRWRDDTDEAFESAVNDLRLKPNYAIALPHEKKDTSLPIDKKIIPEEKVVPSSVATTASTPPKPTGRKGSVDDAGKESPRGKVSVKTIPPKASEAKYATIACQTVSTGEIIATQLYQED